jgi:hypothetical protein
VEGSEQEEKEEGEENAVDGEGTEWRDGGGADARDPESGTSVSSSESLSPTAYCLTRTRKARAKCEKERAKQEKGTTPPSSPSSISWTILRGRAQRSGCFWGPTFTFTSTHDLDLHLQILERPFP